MSTALITKERALAAGKLLQQGQSSLIEVEAMRKLHGDTAASLYRVQALNEFQESLQADDVRALIISAASHSYEVAESDKFKFSPEMKLRGAVLALMKGCLLSDEAGPHFALIAGKGGIISVLIKEAGHRHKLKRHGARNVDVKAVAKMMRLRPNCKASSHEKFDMLIEGEASCEVNGERYLIERKGDMPIILPCYESDGPDGHEAKARRRLLRDLWAKVSGEFDPIEAEEVDELPVSEGAAVRVAEPVKESSVEDYERDCISFDNARKRYRHMIADDADKQQLFDELWGQVNAATTADELEACGERIKGVKADFSERVLGELRRYYTFRQQAIKDGRVTPADKPDPVTTDLIPLDVQIMAAETIEQLDAVVATFDDAGLMADELSMYKSQAKKRRENILKGGGDLESQESEQ